MGLLREQPDGTLGIEGFASQDEFWNLPYNVFEALYGGKVGVGKTDALMGIPIKQFWKGLPLYQYSGFKMCFLRPTEKELELEIIPRFRSFYGALGAEYREQQKDFRWFNKRNEPQAMVKLLAGDDKETLKKIDGSEWNVICFDELQNFPDETRRYALSRCRSTDPDLSGVTIMRYTAMPGGEHHFAVKEYFIDVCSDQAEGREIIEDHAGNKRIFIPGNREENPFLPENYRRQLALMEEHEYRGKALGDWNAFEGEAFPEFRDKRKTREPDNALHVNSTPEPVPHTWKRILAIDPGKQHPAALLWIAISPDKKLRVYREYCQSGLNVTEWASRARGLTGEEKLEAVILDGEAWADRGVGHTIAGQFTRAFGQSAVRADKDRIGGRSVIHELLRWRPIPDAYAGTEYNPDVVADYLRIGKRREAVRYEKLYRSREVETEAMLPRLTFDARSPEGNPIQKVIQVLKTRRNDPKRPEDVQKTNGDDAYDALRYGCNWCWDYMLQLNPSKETKARDDFFRRNRVTSEEITSFMTLRASQPGGKWAHERGGQDEGIVQKGWARRGTGRIRGSGRRSAGSWFKPWAD